MKLLIATRNEGKIREMESLLSDFTIELMTMSDFPSIPEVIEDEPTLEGNARKKAVEVQAQAGVAVISDDTGLEVNALGGRPGVYSARYAGPDGDAVANRALLLKEMRGQRNRSARFRTVLAFKEGSEVLYFEGMCEGALLDEERGEGGFGYDALFVPAGEDRTFAEMDGVSKNRISHRGIALRAFKKYMAERSKAG